MPRLSVALLLIVYVWCATLLADEPAVSGRRVLSQPGLSYGNSFALIVGINYEERYGNLDDPRDKLALPPLRNAESDAKAIYDLLTEHYGYEKENIKLLLGKEATNDAIEREIGQLVDRERVDQDDSVMMFFAGHGFQLTGEQRDRAAIFPHDVVLSGGNPNAKYLRLYSDLFLKLQISPARHKLVILDSCYSGEILKSGFYSASERDDRDSPDRFTKPVFQAIASSRAYEVSSDGEDGEDVNSPFTAALKKALEHLPARTSFDFASGLGTTRLFAYLHPELKGQSDKQEPQFGILEGDGEFRFFPSGSEESREYFSSIVPDPDKQKLLQAAVTSSEGEWWFAERPWFIPSLRKQILAEITPNRSADAELIGRDRLHDITQFVVSKGLKAGALATRTAADSPTTEGKSAFHSLLQLRFKHAKQLLDAEGTPGFKDTIRDIADELDERQKQTALEASDIHLLAILRHELNDRKQADDAYQLALDKYRGGRSEADLLPNESAPDGAGSSDPDGTSPTASKEATALPTKGSGVGSDTESEFEKGLRALCLVDYGEYLTKIKSAREAARRFREADRVFGAEAPAAFRIFVLCREAGVWLQENRWANADERLNDARYLAERFDSSHHLPAYVYRRLAWARMIQWRTGEAEYWFIKSNQVLNNSFAGAAAATRRQALPEADQSPSLGEPAAVAPREEQNAEAEQAAPAENPFRISSEFRDWDNVGARVMFLHNLHGLAMVQRFQGRTKLAAKKYRWLADEVNKALADVAHETKNAESDAEAQLNSRLVNTLERLADCNLFGDPAQRDLAEAIDDYRRALSRCHRISNADTTRAQLLYKQALALALQPDESEINTQDTELALAICQAADEIYQETYAPPGQPPSDDPSESRPTANGMILALGELTTNIVTLISNSQANDSSDDAAFQKAVADLRAGLHDFREQQGPNLHRDQLEICLFASKVLLTHGCEKDRFHLHEDPELLLSFCRMALSPDQVDDRYATGDGETRAYLRPFYDTVMESKLRASAGAPKHVKDLLEVQFEATTGHEYMKREEARPVLAFYVMADKCYLLMDLPWGTSQCYSLSDDYELDEIQDTATEDEAQGIASKLLPLPREVQKSLEYWRDNKAPSQGKVSLVCRWEDLLPRSNVVPWKQTEETHVVAKPVPARFPFDLPAGFERPAARTVLPKPAN